MKSVKQFLPLIALLLLLGCGNSRPEAGYTEEQIACLGADQFAQLCSGDYQCVIAGKHYKVGDKARIGGNWNAPPCPATTTTTDGAQWQFQGNCTCP